MAHVTSAPFFQSQHGKRGQGGRGRPFRLPPMHPQRRPGAGEEERRRPRRRRGGGARQEQDSRHPRRRASQVAPRHRHSVPLED